MASSSPQEPDLKSKSLSIHSSPTSAPDPVSASSSPKSKSPSLTDLTSTVPSSSAKPAPSNDEVEAVIRMATSTVPTPDGRPPPGKDTRTQLFVGNLPYRVRWQDLKDLFRRAGTVLRADVSLSPDNRSRGYGTVLLASAEDAGRAVDMFNGYSWQGRVLEVRLDRLGAIPGTELDASNIAATQGVNISINGLGGIPGIVNNLNGTTTLGGVGTLQVPAPHSVLPFVTPNVAGAGLGPNSFPQSISPALLNTVLGNTLSNSGPSVSPLLNPGFTTFQKQQEQEREGLFLQQARRSSFVQSSQGQIESYLGSVSPAMGDWDSDRPKSSGMRSLFVGNLPFHCQWQDLKDLFRQAGTILRADVSLGPDGRSRGFGTVSFASEIDAERAVAMFNGFDYNGRTLKVHYDKFCAQSPLPLSIALQSTQSSSIPTPIQPNAAATQQAIMQAAQLHQLVNGQGIERYNNLSKDVNISLEDSSSSYVSALQALHETIHPNQSDLHRVSVPGSGSDSSNLNADHSSPPVSPRNVSAVGNAGTSSNLAERRQKALPAPLAASSRPSSGNSRHAKGLSDTFNSMNMNYTNIPNPFNTSPASPKRSRVIGTETSSRPTTSSSRPTTSSTSPRANHPAHPGPISLPPPTVGTFPIPMYSPHNPMSPSHPVSPAYLTFAHSGPLSPVYVLPQHMQPHSSNLTPHGLPPITPSMPSFSFAPQANPGMFSGGVSSSAIPPTPAEGGPYGQQIEASAYNTPTNSGLNMSSMMSPPLHLPQHVFQQFTPGVVMSPGAFYGRPGNGSNGRASYLNPAVGSPVLIHPPYPFSHPGSQPGSPATFHGYGEESNGYFPPLTGAFQSQESYFPPINTFGSSSLANEIMREGSNMSFRNNVIRDDRPIHERNDSGSAPASSESGENISTVDEDHARSSSSGATSWHSPDEGKKSEDSISGITHDMTTFQISSNTNSGEGNNRMPSYAAAAASGTPSSLEDNSSSHGVTRHNSMGSKKDNEPRPSSLQKTHSDETGNHVRVKKASTVAA